ncbi:MAG: DEAD/DEAH box helicase [Wenzhouxiangella sp.]
MAADLGGLGGGCAAVSAGSRVAGQSDWLATASLNGLSAELSAWFQSRFDRPTAIQQLAWPRLAQGDHLLVSAPTGTGKSLSAWLPLIDRQRQRPRQRGVSILYLSPLRSLSGDMAAGLLAQADGLLQAAETRIDKADSRLTVAVRTGDTSHQERQRQSRRPPDILLTTPESLFVLLGSKNGRRMLGTVESVIVDEIHALYGSKRGWHLSLSLERLEQLVGRRVQRVGLSATARPSRLLAGFLVGAGRGCGIVKDHQPARPEIQLRCPPWPLGTLSGPAYWDWLIADLVEQVESGLRLLVFCNTRGLVERLAGRLADQLGRERVCAHHGSLGSRRRREVEQQLKAGQLDLVVCTASLELGLDIGQLDRVAQIGSSAEINTLRQRAGRSGHGPGRRPSLRLYPRTRQELLELRALETALVSGTIEPPGFLRQADDVLCQQLVAMVASGQTEPNTLFGLVRRSFPWRRLSRQRFERLLEALHQGYVPDRETGQGPIFKRADGSLSCTAHWSSRLLMNAGTIPEWFEYEVVEQATGRHLGQLDEEFSFESSPGQIIQLGGQYWKILRIESGRLMVEASDDASAVELPFWFGDGRSRSPALSRRVSSILAKADGGRYPPDRQLAAALEEARQQLGHLPSARRIVVERFFDPAGDQHLVIHATFGAAINRAWGLALRKRFCRGFNFELQAAALDDGLLISLGAVHSFQLSEVVSWLNSATLESLLVQAVLDTPIFQTRFRWVANTALAILKRDEGGAVPAQWQRNQTENLIARIFPDQLACLENLSGHREVPDHPLVDQALHDCLQGHLDLRGLLRIYRGLERGEIQVHCSDREEPSLLAQALIDSPRTAFLDPAAAEERRTRSFEARPSSPARPQTPTKLAPPPADQIADPEQRLLLAGFLLGTEAERFFGAEALQRLCRQQVAFSLKTGQRPHVWVHHDRLDDARQIWPSARLHPFLIGSCGPVISDNERRLTALVRLLLPRVRYFRQLHAHSLREALGLCPSLLQQALARLATEGLIIESEPGSGQWQERSRAGMHAAG